MLTSDWESVTRAFLKYLINMKLSTFCILCCLSAGLSQAATYVWSGAAGNGIYGDSNNWTVNGAPNGYYPQSNSDTAIIGENAGTITWSTGQSYFGATNTVQIDSGSTLLCTTEIGDLNVNSFTLKGNSQLIFESSNALGLGRDFTLNFGTFTAEEHGSWVATNLPSFWTNGKTVTFVGTLDMNNLSGSAAELKLYAYGADGKLAEVGKELWSITDEEDSAVDTLSDGTLYELRVSVADGGAFDLSETEKEIKISVVLAK